MKVFNCKFSEISCSSTSWDISFCVSTRLDNQGVIQYLAGDMKPFLSSSFLTSSGTNPLCYSVGSGGPLTLSPSGKWPRHWWSVSSFMALTEAALSLLICTLLDFLDCLSSFIPLAFAECDNSLLFSGAPSIPLCYTPLPPILPHFILLYISCSISLVVAKFIYNTLWQSYFLPFSVQAQTNVTYLTLFSLL
jgi:hypothetical protein